MTCTRLGVRQINRHYEGPVIVRGMARRVAPPIRGAAAPSALDSRRTGFGGTSAPPVSPDRPTWDTAAELIFLRLLRLRERAVPARLAEPR